MNAHSLVAAVAGSGLGPLILFVRLLLLNIIIIIVIIVRVTRCAVRRLFLARAIPGYTISLGA